LKSYTVKSKVFFGTKHAINFFKLFEEKKTPLVVERAPKI
jgi:hypothetical protein